jgi:hypothetical protein
MFLGGVFFFFFFLLLCRNGGVVCTGVCQTTIVLSCLNEIFQQNLIQMLPHLFGTPINDSEEQETSPSHHREIWFYYEIEMFHAG